MGEKYRKLADKYEKFAQENRHAIENLYPTSMGMAPGHTSNHYPINVSPKFVNDVLESNSFLIKQEGQRSIYQAGNLKIVTEKNIIITVIRVGNERP